MEAVRGALRGMKDQLNNVILILSVLMALGYFTVRAQQATTGQANNFSSVEYFEPPHQTMMRTRLSGAGCPSTGGMG